ncbi:MAG: DUF6429 family protein [bacterium]
MTYSGYISNPKSKAKSVILSEEGVRRSKEFFKKHSPVNRGQVCSAA